MRRIRVLAGLVLGLALVPGGSAQAQTGACEDRDLRGAQCGSFTVPLDHTRPTTSSTIPMGFVRFPAADQAAKRGTVVFLAGGPGQAATPLAGSVANGTLRGLRSRYDLVFVDQRGTGKSAPLKCSTAPQGTFRIEADASVGEIAAAVARCAEELGPDRGLYSTYQTALDLDSLRQVLQVEKIIPLGVSYGGQVAGEYARRFPDRVQSMILDSTGPIEGADALSALPQLALPRVLRETCFPPGCEKILGDPTELLAGAVERIGERGLSGRVVTPAGRRRTARVTVGDVYALIRSSDTDPALRMAIPAALEAAARGDAAPLLRLAFSGQVDGGEEPAAERVNEVRLLATDCIEGRLPWAPDSDPAGRPALLEAALQADAARYAPFPLEAVAAELTATLCLGWPPTPRPDTNAAQRGPNVPVLILGGRADLRTPLEDQRRAGLQYPNANVVGIPGVGHSVLGSDRTGCAQDAVTSFLLARKRKVCVRVDTVPLALPVFSSLSDLPGAAGTAPRRVEQTLVAVDLTLRDVLRQLASYGAGGSSASTDSSRRVVRIGGLRGGRLELRRSTVRLAAYEIVPGVRVSGTLDDELSGTLVVRGTGETGRLLLSESGTLRGVLGDTSVRYRPLPVGAGA